MRLSSTSSRPATRRRWWLALLPRRRRTLISYLAPEPQTPQIVKFSQPQNPGLRAGIALASVTLTGIGLFVPVVNTVGAGLVALSVVALSLEALRDLIRERRLRANVLQAFFAGGLLAAGVPFLAATSTFSYSVGFWFIGRTQDRTLKTITTNYNATTQYALRLSATDAGQAADALATATEAHTPVRALQRGDVVRVYAGNAIPVDGEVVGGSASVDKQQLTGESKLVDVFPGDSVLASGLVVSGYLDVRIDRTGDEIVVAQIEQMLAEAQDYRQMVEARASSLADSTVLPTLGAGAVTGVLFGPVVGYNVVMANYMNVMRLAVSVSLLNYLERISRMGVFVKDGRALELLQDVDTIVFDKTGTLTLNQPTLYKLTPFAGMDADTLLALAAAVEAHQQHPIAEAIRQAATELDLSLPTVEQVTMMAGSGIQARYQGRMVRIGSERMMRQAGIDIPAEAQTVREAALEHGATLVYIALDEQLYGTLELQQTIRASAAEVVARIKQLGLSVIVMSGDETNATTYLAQQVGIDEAIAGVLPQDKGRLIERWQAEGRNVCFVGDGINDALALRLARVSMTLRGASAIATDSAQIILLNEDLRSIPQLIELARQYQRDVTINAGTPVLGSVIGMASVTFGGLGLIAVYGVWALVGGVSFTNALLPRLRPLETE